MLSLSDHRRPVPVTAGYRGPVLAGMSPHTTPSSLFILTRRTHAALSKERERGRSENR
uniref:Uncharacterized protein n=1 Tax=Helianthus annuus TaxID=4232 RepID=A0A251SG68_HELAN